ncbi:MAG TPA: SUMF1/EgtB/PvdO family nonheme iron enzyme [Polyangiaceae bacterium]|nr:SUMF1/EgtB/PvdO family nonheme iron enzyme [Polyangiaceae bacterium]
MSASPSPTGPRLAALSLHLPAAFAALAAIAIVVQLALLERRPPVRCPSGLALVEGRCCGGGQTLVGGHCEGALTSCGPSQQVATLGQRSGCVLQDDVVAIRGGVLPQGAADWQVQSRTAKLHVPAFAIDRGEVTAARYEPCARAGACEPLPAEPEPGLPVTGLPPRAAERFCRFVGGRLPSSAEWRYAASGSDGRRFPWGFTGLVCRRSAFGLSAGPCSQAGAGPDLAGARPPGATPEGVLDLSGNVAEWTRDPDGRYRARGGSFRSRVAAELVTAAVESPPPQAPYVGFRCVYAPD